MSKKDKARSEAVQKLERRKKTQPGPNKKKETEAHEEEEDESAQVPDDLSILDALTAIPVPDDELLYAVPVCAPYTTMTNYK